MAIFTRRSLQDMLDANATFLTPLQLQHHVRALNLNGHNAVNSLAAEWEVVLLRALSFFGRVEHEVDCGGSSRPDLYFHAPNDESLVETVRQSHPEAAKYIDRMDRWMAGEEIAENLSTYDERCLRCEWEKTPYLQSLKELADKGALDQFVEENPFSFIADIATVTDEGLHERNPIEAFTQELIRLLRKHNISNGIRYNVGSFSDREAVVEKRKLKLPPRGELNSRIFGTSAFKRFINDVKTQSEQQHQVKFHEDGIEAEFYYHPEGHGLTGSHAPFRGVNRYAIDLRARGVALAQYDWKSNGVYHALRNKSDQLKKSGATCRRGIFLCDGGSQLMHDKGIMDNRTSPQVIQPFLNESSSVDFVVAISVDWGEKPRPTTGFLTSRLIGASLGDRVPQLMLGCYVNPRLLSDLPGQYFAASLRTLCLATRLRLPDPVATPENALHWLRSPQSQEGRASAPFTISGSLMNPQKISFSARALLEVLAGKTDLNEFLQRYGMAPSGDPHLDSLRKPRGNPFKAALESGNSVSFADLEVLTNQDDNLLTLHFKRDPAVAPFVAPVPNQDEDIQNANLQAESATDSETL